MLGVLLFCTVLVLCRAGWAHVLLVTLRLLGDDEEADQKRLAGVKTLEEVLEWS
jgi:hypothetical protein